MYFSQWCNRINVLSPSLLGWLPAFFREISVSDQCTTYREKSSAFVLDLRTLTSNAFAEFDGTSREVHVLKQASVGIRHSDLIREFFQRQLVSIQAALDTAYHLEQLDDVLCIVE